MRAVEPASVSVLVALQAIVVHHQCPRRNEVARGRAGQRRFEIFSPFHRPDPVLLRVLRVEKDHSQYEQADRRSPASSDLPVDARAGESVEDVEPERHYRRDDMRPIGDRSQVRVFKADVFKMKNVEARKR